MLQWNQSHHVAALLARLRQKGIYLWPDPSEEGAPSVQQPVLRQRPGAMSDEARVLYLTSEGDRFLIKASLLWVSDVRGGNCGEWQTVVWGMRPYFLLIFICFYGQFASNGVPNIKNSGI